MYKNANINPTSIFPFGYPVYKLSYELMYFGKSNQNKSNQNKSLPVWPILKNHQLLPLHNSVVIARPCFCIIYSSDKENEGSDEEKEKEEEDVEEKDRSEKSEKDIDENGNLDSEQVSVMRHDYAFHIAERSF